MATNTSLEERLAAVESAIAHPKSPHKCDRHLFKIPQTAIALNKKPKSAIAIPQIPKAPSQNLIANCFSLSPSLISTPIFS
jgi:hypothetical protein